MARGTTIYQVASISSLPKYLREYRCPDCKRKSLVASEDWYGNGDERTMYFCVTIDNDGVERCNRHHAVAIVRYV